MEELQKKIIETDEARIKSFLKEMVACARALGKRVDVPYIELISMVELAKAKPDDYARVRAELVEAPAP